MSGFDDVLSWLRIEREYQTKKFDYVEEVSKPIEWWIQEFDSYIQRLPVFDDDTTRQLQAQAALKLAATAVALCEHLADAHQLPEARCPVRDYGALAMNARDLAATVQHEAIVNAFGPHKGHDGIPGAPEGIICIRCIGERALAALEKQAADAQACNCLIRESVSQCPVHLPAAYKVMKARAVRAEEALRQIASLFDDDDAGYRAKDIARAALAAAGADTAPPQRSKEEMGIDPFDRAAAGADTPQAKPLGKAVLDPNAPEGINSALSMDLEQSLPPGTGKG